MSQALFPINPGQKIMCKRKNLANNARSYASTLLPPTITLRSLQHTERQPSRERCFKGRVLSRFHFFFKIFLNDSIAFPTYALWLSKHLMSQLFIWRLNRNIIIIIISSIIVIIIIIIIIINYYYYHFTCNIRLSSDLDCVSLTVLKVEAWSKQCHKPAPIGQDDKH